MRVLVIASRWAGVGRGHEALPVVPGADVRFADHAGHAEALAAAAGDYDAVVAAGGDGTVHEVVNGLMAHPRPPALGLLPLGTGNDIARNLGLLTAADALAALAAGARRPLDLLRVDLWRDGGRARVWSILNCGIGFGGEVVRQTTPGVKRWWGPSLAYSVGTLRALWHWQPPLTTVCWDGGVWRGRPTFLALGNGEYESAGTMRLSPGARLDDGLANLTLIREGPKLMVVRHFPKIADGTHLELPQVHYATTTRLSVTSARPVPIQSDGDVIGQTPCRVVVAPGALQVLAQ